MCNDDWFFRWIASVLASFTLQSAICFTNGASHSTMWIHRVEVDFVQTLSPENFMIIFEILPTDKEWKSTITLRIAVQILDELWLSRQRYHSSSWISVHIDCTRTQNLQLCFVLPNKIRIFQSFLQSQSFRSLKLPFANFSSDVVSRRCPSHVSSSPLFVRYSIVWFNNSIVNVGMKFAR